MSAYYLLGEIYCEEEMFDKAKEWTTKAIESGNLDAKELWEKCNLAKH